MLNLLGNQYVSDFDSDEKVLTHLRTQAALSSKACQQQQKRVQCPLVKPGFLLVLLPTSCPLVASTADGLRFINLTHSPVIVVSYRLAVGNFYETAVDSKKNMTKQTSKQTGKQQIFFLEKATSVFPQDSLGSYKVPTS